MFAQTALDENNVVQRGDDREEEGCAKKNRARNPYPSYRFHFKQKDEKQRADLRKGIGLAEDAGAEIPQSGDREQDGAGGENRNVAAENHNRILPGNLVKYGQHKKQRAEQEFVGDGIEVLAEQRLLMKSAGEQAIEAIAEACDDKESEGPEVVSVDKMDDDEGDEHHPEQSELIGSSEDLRELHAGSLDGYGLDS
jgi:hypothetical protein